MNNKDVNYFLNLELIQAKKGQNLNEVPIGAVVVNTDKSIITKGFNQTESTSNPMAHAEMIAIEKAAKENKDWRGGIACSCYSRSGSKYSTAATYS